MKNKNQKYINDSINAILKDAKAEFAAKTMKEVVDLLPGSFDFIGLELQQAMGVECYEFAAGNAVKGFLEHYSVLIESGAPAWAVKRLCAGKMYQRGFFAEYFKKGISTLKARQTAQINVFKTRVIAEEEEGTLIIRLDTTRYTAPEDVVPFVNALKRYERPKPDGFDIDCKYDLRDFQND